LTPTFLARRGWTQAGLLAAVLAVVVVGTTLLGTCALLLTTGQDRAREAALRSTPAEQLTTEVRLTRLGNDPAGATATAAGVLRDALAPLPVTTSTWATSSVRDLPADASGDRRLGYLADIDDLPDVAGLADGRWPVAGTGPPEVAVPVPTAARLGLALGDRVTLGPSLEPTGLGDTSPVTAVVVGTFTPATGGWSRDLLGGAGYTARFEFGVFGGVQLPAFGPFVVAPHQLLDAGGGVDRVSLLAAPDLGGASAADLADARAGLEAAPAQLRAALAGNDVSSRVVAELPATLTSVAATQAVTGSGVLVVALVGFALAGTALGLAGRLVAGRRAAELALLTARGARRGQLVAGAAAEGAVLAVVAAMAAVPLSLLLFRWLAGLPRLADAGLSGAAAPTPALVGTLAVGALLLAGVLVVPALRPAEAGDGRRSTRGLVIRSGADVVLAALAVVGFLQLRGRPATETAGVDPLLTTAPVVCLLAGAVLALRVVPLVARLAERSAGRSRRLVLPLAAWELARRPHATGAAFLLVLATAAATFGVAFTSTWRSSQTEQADARVGSALAVPAPTDDLTGQGAAVRAAVGGTISPVDVRPVALGTAVRTADGTATQLVAVDTRHASELLRGRLPDGRSWPAVTSGLTPKPAVGLALGAGPVVLTGASAGTVLIARPTLLVEDVEGSRLSLDAEPVVLDGAPHPLSLQDADGQPPSGELTVVGLDLEVSAADPDAIDPETALDARLQVALGVPGATTSDARWTARQPPVEGRPPVEPSAAVSPAPDGAVLTTTAQVAVGGLPLGPVHLLVTAAPPPSGLPVLLSADLAAAAGAEPGDRLALLVGSASLVGVVAGVVPYVPSLPGAPGLLADYQALARALTAVGNTDPLTTGWWAGDVPDLAGAPARLADAGLPGAVTAVGLGDQLRDGPLRVGLLAAVALLVAAAGALALTGTALHTAAALSARAVETARLQGLGVPRRALAGALVAEHTAVTTLSVGLGVGVGALAAWLVAPLMTVTERGTTPVPGPLPHWPWPAESLLVAGLLVGCAAVAVPVAAVLGRRATATHLRLDGGA